jgi:protein O-GlcNAc transferase
MTQDARALVAEALVLAARGAYGEAQTRARAAVTANPNNAAALDLLARLLTHFAKAREALPAAVRAAALEPTNASYRYTLGRVREASGDAPAAMSDYEQTLRLNPSHVRAHVSLGLARSSADRHEEAISCYRRALELDPANAEACMNLARELALLGQDAEPGLEAGVAIARARMVEQAARLRELADRAVAAGRPFEALERLADARQMAPGDAALHLYAAKIHESMGKLDDALASCMDAVRVQPQWLLALRLTVITAATCGLAEVAREYASRGIALDTSDAFAIAAELALPAICDSVEDISVTRRRLATGLDHLLARPLRLETPECDCPMPGFFLAYHGQNNCELKEKMARMFLSASPGLQWQSEGGGKSRSGNERLRIGFASRYLRNHSIGKTSRGLMARLCRKRFEVVAVHIPPVIEDATSRWIDEHSDESITLVSDLALARRQIADLGLDVLFYQDIGMEPLSYFLAFARLAPVQCVSFGHPDTTGIPNVDFFISNDAYEPVGAAAHYSERLFLLHDLPTLAYYYRPMVEKAPDSRARLGLSAHEHLYVCPQALFKLHPDFDALLAAILRRDPQGRLVLISNVVGRWAGQLQQRFARTMPDVANQITFLDSMPHERFLTLLAAADAVLDTLHFNGMNSSLEAFAAGAPVVTLPGDFQRGRHTAAMYRAMGMQDCIAASPEDYVGMAVRLGTDSHYRHALSARIAANSSVLFENERVVAEFERFFLEAVRLKEGTR